MSNSSCEQLSTRKSQKGAATLVTALVVLVVVLAISFYTSETVVIEKKVVANEYRAKQAFHAAQAGLDYGIAYAKSGLDQNNDSVLDLSVSAATASIGNASYSVLLSDISASGDMSLIQVTSTGASDDGLISRMMSVLIGEVPSLPNPPDLPVVARGNVNTIGNMQIYNHFENFNVWTGEELDSWGSSDTYIRDPSWTDTGWDGDPDTLSEHLESTGQTVLDVDSIQSTTKNTRGPDVIDGDASLSTLTGDEFIQNFFGKTASELENVANTSLTESEFGSADWTNLGGQIIELDDEGDGTYQISSATGTVGTSSSPVILVTDGDIRITGNVQIFGLVVAKNFVSAAGTVDVVGGVLAEEEIERANGTFSVYFDPGVTGKLADLKTMEVVRGSWKDW